MNLAGEGGGLCRTLRVLVSGFFFGRRAGEGGAGFVFWFRFELFLIKKKEN